MRRRVGGDGAAQHRCAGGAGRAWWKEMAASRVVKEVPAVTPSVRPMSTLEDEGGGACQRMSWGG